MRISFVYPDKGVNIEGKNFLWWVVQELKTLGHKILENECDKNTELIICMSISQMERARQFHIAYPKIPIISYNWDWYPWADQNKEYKTLLYKSLEVWSASKDAAQSLYLATGINSIPIYGCIVPEEWGDTKDEGYAVMASRNEWYKRFDWFKSACQELKIPFISYHPEVNTRENYIKGVVNCSLMVSSSLYEGFGLTPIEAAYLNKPLVLADTDIFRELWDGKAYFFNPHRYDDFKKILKQAYNEKKFNNNRKYVEENFLPKHMAKRMHERFLTNFWI